MQISLTEANMQRKITLEVIIDEQVDMPVEIVSLFDHLENEARDFIENCEPGYTTITRFLIKSDKYI